MQFSHRTGEQSLNALSVRSQQLQEQGISVTHLNDSNPTHFGLSVHGPDFIYHADPRGDLKARRSLVNYLSRRYSRELDVQQLYILNSTSQAYAWLMMLLCDPGDCVLFPQPGYPLIESICALTGVKSVPYRLLYDGSWMIDYVSIEQALHHYNQPDSEHPIKALILINPNNPTNSYVKAEERARIIALCQRYKVALIADEVFYDFSLQAFDSRSRFVGENAVLTFTIDGFSKMLAAADAKVGWIYVSGPENDKTEALQRLDMIADDFLPMSSLITQQIESLLARADEQTERIRSRCLTNLNWLLEYTADAQRTQGIVTPLRSEGGWSVMLRLPSSLDDDEVGIELLNRIHALSAPGYFFDCDSSGYMAVSLLPEPEIFSRIIQDTISVIESMIDGK
ncbi:pyridoxal phosphate-dependent aminotransferase [Alloscardovia omnicolens]|uniref:pyridoxal phosphate-dependent aminotransferase n=1 Tax=Alloscardovia omnicolens TaxID=419015 RepID=UPI003A6389B1